MLATAAAAAQMVAPVSARTPKRGGGLWLDVGAGYGHLRLTCVNCPTVVAANGRAVTVSAGYTPARNVLLGLQAQQWSSSGGSPGQRVSSIFAVVQWYPWPTTGFFMRAGNGIVRGPVGSQAAGPPSSSTEGTGVGFALGLGYDVKLSRRLGLTVQAATDIAALGDLTIGGQSAEDVIAYVTRLGVAVVLR